MNAAKPATGFRHRLLDTMRRAAFVTALASAVAVGGGAIHQKLGFVGHAAAASAAEAQRIADHFSRVKTMTGEFVQFGPRGEQTGGKFFIDRPGKIRFNYEAPSNFKVIADGKSVVINNPKLKTWDLYQLSQTPLKLLLSERIDLSRANVQDVRQDDDMTTIVMTDRSVFGKAKIAMMFDANSLELKQWTITDAQGKDTTVMIFNVKQGMALDQKMFKIDYEMVVESQAPKIQR